jgi:hypothetical protein
MIVDSSLVNNPFTALGAIAGPAILTNACSVPALGTSNRLSRVVDRTRIVVHDIKSSTMEAKQRAFYAALGLFAAAALLSAMGSVLATFGRPIVFDTVAIVALGAGTGAVASLARGCVQMVRETRLAVRSLQEEAGARTAV